MEDILKRVNKVLDERKEVYTSKQPKKEEIIWDFEQYLEEYFPNKLQDIYNQTVKLPSFFDFQYRPGFITYTSDSAGSINNNTSDSASYANTYYFGNYVNTLTNIKPYLIDSD